MYLRYLDRHIQTGTLHLHLPDGSLHTFGEGEPQVDWFLHTRRTLKRIMHNPARMLGETYVRAEWDVNAGQLPDLLDLLLSNIPVTPRHPLAEHWQRLRMHLPDFTGSRSAGASPASFEAALLRRFLDADLHYNSGYFSEPDISLEEAQRAKCRHLMNKLRLQAGQHVLDLNGDWGGVPMYLAEHGNVHVTALVRSNRQLRQAQDAAYRRGLHEQISFQLRDYREQRGKFDRVVALGLVEQLKPSEYPGLFRQMAELLTGDGIAVVQAVGRLGAPGPINPWLKQHVFPDHYNPALSQLSHGLEASGLITCDVEVLQEHFAHTLAAWQRRFQRNRPAVAHQMGERFCRMWEFYLAACEAGFKWRDLAVFELQLSRHKRIVPTTRGYQHPHAVEPPASVPSVLAELSGHRSRTEGD